MVVNPRASNGRGLALTGRPRGDREGVGGAVIHSLSATVGCRNWQQTAGFPRRGVRKRAGRTAKCGSLYPKAFAGVPAGTGCATSSCPRSRSLDLATKQTRRLTRLNNRGAMRTFDIAPDGKQIVFDRLRENSDIVLIDLRR